MAVPYFLKQDGDALLFNQDKGYLQFFVPEKLFETKKAIVVGEYVNLIGILDYTIYDGNGKNNGLKPFRFPTVFLAKPGEIEKVRDIQLTKYTDRQDYRLLKFYKGDQVVVSTKVPKGVGNIEEFFRIITGGTLPRIRYDVIHEYFNENAALNGFNYGVTSQMLGIIVSELCRDPNDLSRPFRMTKMEDMSAYKPINIEQIPYYISPYTSITNINWDKAVVNACLLQDGKESPLEKVLTESVSLT